ERRRLVLRKFPYSIVYEIIKEKIVVLAIAHGRRRPYYPGVTGRGKGRIDPWFARNRVMIESESGHNRAVDEGSRGVRV
ncbi:MAG: hypothetical protein HY694_13680, partial [Deltaproteobacteria bacterium]|nr:hypothetical protein [Deltaproteobacteria bacterium]